MAVNVIAAYFIISGDKLTKFGFKVGIVMILSLDYLAFRFRPKSLHFDTPEWPLRILDVMAALGTLSFRVKALLCFVCLLEI